jgi:NAD-dependent DNA ligase
MSSLPQLLDQEHSQAESLGRIGIIEEKCPDCGARVSYELGAGNAFCTNPNCGKIMYES